eukprot:97614-Pyramimonas_sp.AAC.1
MLAGGGGDGCILVVSQECGDREGAAFDDTEGEQGRDVYDMVDADDGNDDDGCGGGGYYEELKRDDAEDEEHEPPLRVRSAHEDTPEPVPVLQAGLLLVFDRAEG